MDALYNDNRISQNKHIDGEVPVWVNADTGLSVGMRDYVEQVHGQTRLVPIYSEMQASSGNNLELKITRWGIVTVVDSSWNGNNNTWVEIQKSYAYMGALSPQSDLTTPSAAMEGAFTSPVLVE